MSETQRDKTVGVVGVGVMGGGMARNLIDKGFTLSAYDIDTARLDAIVSHGARRAGSAAEVARQARIQICMVETTEQARSVILGEGGLTEGMQSGDRVLCCSTITPQVVQEMHAKLAERGVELLDVPVSGGSVRADNGDLTAIIGGDAAAVEDVRPVIEAFASKLFHVGGVGQGLAMKLVNNMMLQITCVALCEAFVLGAKAGLDPKVMHEVMRVSTAASTALDMRAPRFISGDFSPGGTVDINYKDQQLETEFAKSLGVPMLMANVSQQVFQMARAEGLGKLDSAAVIEIYEQMAGVQLGPRKPR
ncbi:MAG: NAD(P)-dependent oxidoreductase [Gammaproteobacteria bacterium]|nr:NAD(P)-dependent oxidoreductase [Gammaproteobacteria bacterium]